MNKSELYRKLPTPLKSTAASLWGLYLRWLRYGPRTEDLIAEAHQRETWDEARWCAWREKRLVKMLDRAARTVPYYRAHWETRRRKGDGSSWECLENWPVLEKAVVRENPAAFISEEAKGKHLYQEHTGGTTGVPTLIYMSRDVIQRWFALYEARTRRWLGLDYRDRWGIFGGQKIISLSQEKPPYWVWNRGMNQVYFSIFHIKPETAGDYVDALWHYRPKSLIVYPSSLAVLSKFILAQGLELPPLNGIISNSETLTEGYRALIEGAFNCPLMDTYGMVEMLAQTSECNHGRMHFWPETGVIEHVDPDSGEVSRGDGTGLYCMTGLINRDMPLIRYVSGDVGFLPRWEGDCPCGRNLPVMAPVQGRSNDLIHTKDGRELYILDSLYNGLPIVEGQLVQEELDIFEVKVVPGGVGYTKADVEREIRGRLHQYLGDVEIKFSEVREIPRSSNGKFKPFVSKINPIEKRLDQG